MELIKYNETNALKILFPFVGDSVGGSHVSSIELYKLLIENNYEVLVLLHNANGPLSKVLKENNIQYCELSTSFLAGDSPKKIMIIFGIIRNIIPFIRFIKNNNVDIVHGNDLRINLTWSIATRISGAKFIWHQRTILSNSALWKCIPFLCSHFIAISKAVLNSAPKNFREPNKSLVYNAFDTDTRHNSKNCRKDIVEQFQISRETIILGCVGRLVNYKNIDFLIKCLHELIEIHKKDVHLLIVGNGSEEYKNYLENIVSELKLDSNVSFSGFVSNPLEFISGTDILIASSSIDAFGRTIVEAMLQSTPVLAANKGGHLEIVIDECNGLLFEANSKTSFISKVIRLIDDKLLRENIVTSALEASESKYSRSKHFLSVKKIYSSLF